MIASLRAQIFRFSAVGICATITHLLIATVFHYGLGMPELQANLGGFALAWLVSYFGNYVWTFGAVSDHRQSIPLFMAVSVVGFAINQLIVWLMTEMLELSFFSALIPVIFVIPAVTFFLSRFWVFLPADPRSAAGRERPRGLDHVRKPVAFSEAALGLAMTCGVVIVSCALQLPLPVNHDAAWVLIGASKMVEGATFGTDVVDINPPLAWWISMIPVVLSNATGLALPPIFKLFVIALATSSLALSHDLMRRHCRHPRDLWLLTTFMAAVLLLQPGYDFGQREHLMVILVLPYICMSILRVNGGQPGWRLAFVVGVIAALGICLKPYFLVVPLAVELFVLVAVRRLKSVFRIEISVMFCCGLIYLLAVWLAAPAYLNEVLPSAVESYDAYDSHWVTVLRSTGLTLAPIIIAILAIGLCGAAPLKEGRFRVFLWAALGATVSVLLQMKGWSYHIFPATALAVVGTVMVAATARPAAFAKKGLAVGLASAAIVYTVGRAPVGLAVDAWSPNGGTALVRELAGRLEELSEPSDKVFAFITSPRAVMPAVLETRRRWASTACCMHFLPAAVRDLKGGDDGRPVWTARRAINARDQLSEVAIDLGRHEPKVVVVDSARKKLGFGPYLFDYLQYLANDPRFIRILGRYREVNPVGYFRVFVRKDREQPSPTSPRDTLSTGGSGAPATADGANSLSLPDDRVD